MKSERRRIKFTLPVSAALIISAQKRWQIDSLDIALGLAMSENTEEAEQEKSNE